MRNLDHVKNIAKSKGLKKTKISAIRLVDEKSISGATYSHYIFKYEDGKVYHLFNIKSWCNFELVEDGEYNNEFKEQFNKEIDATNYFIYTSGTFEETETPDREPDHISYDRNGNISSCYWYDGEHLIRKSNHWGEVASCNWQLEGYNKWFCYHVSENNPLETATARIKFSELKRVI